MARAADSQDKQDKNVPPIAVTLVGSASLARLKAGSLAANLSLPDGTACSAAEFFAALGVQATSLGMTIVIVNALDSPLCLMNQYIDCGNAIGRPAELDMSSNVLFPHRIPGKREDPLTAGAFLYGVGCYQFEAGSFTGEGTGGAMDFTYGDSDTPPFVGISWLTPMMGSRGCGVTADMSKYSSDLPTFYNATANYRNETLTDTGKETKLTGILGIPPGDYPTVGYDTCLYGFVLTVVVEPV